MLAQPTRQTTAVYLHRWLDDAARPEVRAATYTLYEGLIRKHIAPRVGGVALAKLQAMHIQNLFTAMEDTGRRPNSGCWPTGFCARP
jgi:hypothetical protein